MLKWKNMVRLFVIVCAIWTQLVINQSRAYAADTDVPNRISRPRPDATIKDVVSIRGVANHENFLKWQLDLLLNRDPEQATYLARSSRARPTLVTLFRLDTTLYPDGPHTIRLRVVQKGADYEEYFVDVHIDNSVTPARNDGLTDPLVGSTVSGDMPIRGIANHPELYRWELWIYPDGEENKAIRLRRTRTPRTYRRLLYTLDTTQFPNGPYIVRLRVIHDDRNYDDYPVPIVIHNKEIPLGENGFTKPTDGAAASEDTSIEGVADHLEFEKWQLDLLLNADPEQATFLAWSDEPEREPAQLFNLDTTNFPNGKHRLRLRVVRTGFNYDEYFVNVVINNQ